MLLVDKYVKRQSRCVQFLLECQDSTTVRCVSTVVVRDARKECFDLIAQIFNLNFITE
jgi:hypothetical protein